MTEPRWSRINPHNAKRFRRWIKSSSFLRYRFLFCGSTRVVSFWKSPSTRLNNKNWDSDESGKFQSKEMKASPANGCQSKSRGPRLEAFDPKNNCGIPAKLSPNAPRQNGRSCCDLATSSDAAAPVPSSQCLIARIFLESSSKHPAPGTKPLARKQNEATNIFGIKMVGNTVSLIRKV